MRATWAYEDQSFLLFGEASPSVVRSLREPLAVSQVLIVRWDARLHVMLAEVPLHDDVFHCLILIFKLRSALVPCLVDVLGRGWDARGHRFDNDTADLEAGRPF